MYHLIRIEYNLLHVRPIPADNVTALERQDNMLSFPIGVRTFDDSAWLPAIWIVNHNRLIILAVHALNLSRVQMIGVSNWLHRSPVVKGNELRSVADQ